MLKALVFQLLESRSLSSHWFQISTCTPTPRLKRAYKIGLTLLATSPTPYGARFASGILRSFSFDEDKFFSADGAGEDIAKKRREGARARPRASLLPAAPYHTPPPRVFSRLSSRYNTISSVYITVVQNQTCSFTDTPPCVRGTLCEYRHGQARGDVQQDVPGVEQGDRDGEAVQVEHIRLTPR